jgi:hypothetical protein
VTSTLRSPNTLSPPSVTRLPGGTTTIASPARPRKVILAPAASPSGSPARRSRPAPTGSWRRRSTRRPRSCGWPSPSCASSPGASTR